MNAGDRERVEVGQMEPARLDALIATVIAIEAAQDAGEAQR